jgi:predicted transcriptional regulator
MANSWYSTFEYHKDDDDIDVILSLLKAGVSVIRQSALDHTKLVYGIRKEYNIITKYLFTFDKNGHIVIYNPDNSSIETEKSMWNFCRENGTTHIVLRSNLGGGGINIIQEEVPIDKLFSRYNDVCLNGIIPFGYKVNPFGKLNRIAEPNLPVPSNFITTLFEPKIDISPPIIYWRKCLCGRYCWQHTY